MGFIYTSWWKILGVLLVVYSIIGGLLIPVPAMPILNETIRNLYFHVPVWMAMSVLFSISVFYSIKYLLHPRDQYDVIAVETINAGLLFYVLGLVTGMIWAQYTWGQAWSNDIKQICAAIAFLVYCAYLVLRNSVEEEQKKARISAVYNLFAYPLMIVLVLVLPRMSQESLHPGNAGNPAFGKYDLDSLMKLVLYPTFIGWSLVGVWIASLRYRLRMIELRHEDAFTQEK